MSDLIIAHYIITFQTYAVLSALLLDKLVFIEGDYHSFGSISACVACEDTIISFIKE